MVESPQLSAEPVIRATSHGEPLVDLSNDSQRIVLERLREGVEAITGAEGFHRWLQTLTKFHPYSLSNTILIASQCPDATRVMGYGNREGTTGWKSLGRQVKQGEHAIKIFAPLKRKELDPETLETVWTVYGYKVVNVWDISQTDGEPFPEPPLPAEELGDSDVGRAVDRKLSLYLIGNSVRLEQRYTLPKHAWYLPKNDIQHHPKIALGEHLIGNRRTKSLVHEAAHWMADHNGQVDKADAETVAESSAYVVLNRFGIDSGDYSFAYVATWAKDADVLKRNVTEIRSVSHKLITAIEGEQPEGEEEWL